MTSSRYVDDPTYHELSGYTLGLADPAFIHQHIVDTYGAQTAAADDKPVRIAMALTGLYLHVDQGMTGKQVQRIHQLLGNQRPAWPRFSLPDDRGPMPVRDVWAASPGESRASAIHTWCTTTWEALSACRAAVQDPLIANGIDV
ncbi:MAG: DUF5946 family protein [Actinomycetota bacterium]|nr:DUF5946 family protein [Actinomycetota bacterium]